VDDHKKTSVIQEVNVDSHEAVADLKSQCHPAINASVLASLPDCGTKFRGDLPDLTLDIEENELLLPINEDWVIKSNESLNL
jgi:hypothetical protein